MSNLSEIVDSLENRVGKLLQEHDNLKHTKSKLEEDITVLKAQHDQYKKEIENWRDECNTLKLANSMLGSDNNKKEAKLKINTLIRDIDHCIAQLSE